MDTSIASLIGLAVATITIVGGQIGTTLFLINRMDQTSRDFRADMKELRDDFRADIKDLREEVHAVGEKIITHSH